MERVLKGKEETITYKEADELAGLATDNLLGHICSLVDEASEDEEERANAKVVMAHLVGKAMNAAYLAGVLCDPDHYLSTLLPEDATGVEVSIEEAKEA